MSLILIMTTHRVGQPLVSGVGRVMLDPFADESRSFSISIIVVTIPTS
jgi:hypothetical protein